ncbi:MAG TPA: hypothetical protein VMD25_02015 [Acidobacteriaceae bacterium]|nr:hypothetical protein [Acidobacteriaceae bacterium]
MRTTGWFCILAASLLFLASLNTLYTRTVAEPAMSVQPIHSAQELPWQFQAGIEAISGVAFLVPGIGMLAPFGVHRRRHRSGS